jgi:2-polyprenyl-3-methyl-5-hydroxy-6-metoxy-1,4-benzoquinol methylase
LRSLDEGYEYEISFGFLGRSRLGLLEFRKVLDYVKSRSDLSFKKIQELDIIYNPNIMEKNTMRFTIAENSINNVIQSMGSKKITNIIGTLSQQVLTNGSLSSDIVTIFKDKESTRNQCKDSPEFRLRNRLAHERPLTKRELESLTRLTTVTQHQIHIRLKSRLSCVIYETDNISLKLDITAVRSDHKLNRVAKQFDSYEVELEVFRKKSDTSTIEMIDLFPIHEKILNDILVITEGSESLIDNEKKTKVLEMYRDLLNIKTRQTMLFTMQPFSLDLGGFINLSNNYAVTDKADGEKVHMLIHNGELYIINTSLRINVFKWEVVDSKWNNSILEGELVGERLLLFDAIVVSGIDIRPKLLQERINILGKLLSSINKKSFTHPTIDIGMDIDSFMENHKKYAREFSSHINANPRTIEKKYFIFTNGQRFNEIYQAAMIISNEITADYPRDGLIFPSQKQPYCLFPEQLAFKWKPHDKNTIDFYIEFKKDDMNRILHVYDNADNADNTDNTDTYDEMKTYRITELMVGNIEGGQEIPKPFMESENNHICHIYEKDGKVYDSLGHIVNDKTVVEMAYDSNNSIPQIERWKIIQTRYDKTQVVKEHMRKYGNSYKVAEHTWDSIKTPVELDMFKQLAVPNEIVAMEIRSKFSQRLSVAQKRQENIMLTTSRDYKKRKQLCDPLHNYHDWYKSILMYQYFSDKKLKILDIGIGEGADIEKLEYCQPHSVVGIDINQHSMIKVNNGAIERYQQLARTRASARKAVPMHFIHANFGVELTKTAQQNLVGIGQKSLEQVEKHLENQKFDAINCQFTIDNFFKDQEIFDQICKNIDNCLNKDGLILITTIDGDKINEYLDSQDSKSTTYLDAMGKENTFFSIDNLSIDKKNRGVGQCVQLKQPSDISEKGQIHYMVYKDYLVSEFKKRNIELIETMTFEDMMELQKPFFIGGVVESEPVRFVGKKRKDRSRFF